MAGALNSHFLQLRKAPKKPSKDSQEDRKQFLVALTTQHLTFRGKFPFPAHALTIGAVQPGGSLKQINVCKLYESDNRGI